MIEKIRNILQDSKCNIVESNEKLVLFQGEQNNYPEDYIEIENVNEKYIVSEVHRDIKQIKEDTENRDEAIVYAVIIYKRLYDDIADKMIARNIRSYLDFGMEKKAIDYICHNFADSIYSIGSENNLKISLMKSDDTVNVKFGGEYLAENATLSRGYVVLYNYCEKLLHISLYYDAIQKKIHCPLNRERILKLYILGK